MENPDIWHGSVTDAIEMLDNLWWNFCEKRNLEELDKNKELLVGLKSKIEEVVDYLVENAGKGLDESH